MKTNTLHSMACHRPISSPFAQQVTFLSVSSLDASSAFYGDILKLPLVLDQGPCRLFAVSSAAFIGLCTCTGPVETRGIILTLVHDDITAWHNTLKSAGVTITKKPQFNAQFNITHLFALDPDGYTVEIQTFHDPAWPCPT